MNFDQEYANLNDYVLFDIFKLLSIIELQECRLVCKRWKNLIDSMRLKKLIVTYFSKHSWVLNENYFMLKQYADSIDVRSIDSFSRILFKPQFKDLEQLVLVTEQVDTLVNKSNYLLDLSIFRRLKNLEIYGNQINLKENQVCESITHFTTETSIKGIFQAFPNLIFLKTNYLDSETTNCNLEILEYFNQDLKIQYNQLYEICPNIKTIFCNIWSILTLLKYNDYSDEFMFINLKKAKIFFKNALFDTLNIEQMIKMAKSLNIELEIHIHYNMSNQELIEWFILMQKNNVHSFYYEQKKVDLSFISKFTPNELNSLMTKAFKTNSLLNIEDEKILTYLLNTCTLELNENLEKEFIVALRNLPLIKNLIIKHEINQSTFNSFEKHCSYLNSIKIDCKTKFKLDLKFIEKLDHLTSLVLNNLELTNCKSIAVKVKLSKFFHIINLKNCDLDLDFCSIANSVVNKATKNPEKFYEIHFWPILHQVIIEFNLKFKNAPENFYSNFYRLETSNTY